MKFHDAQLLENLTYDEVLSNNLRIMDYTAIALAKENNLKLVVCSLFEKDAIVNCLTL
jgi:uridylate kinase